MLLMELYLKTFLIQYLEGAERLKIQLLMLTDMIKTAYADTVRK